MNDEIWSDVTEMAEETPVPLTPQITIRAK